MDQIEPMPWLTSRHATLPKWAQRQMSNLRCEVINLEMGMEVDSRVREVMLHWTGTNCTFADDDAKALGILAGLAIAAGLHKGAALPASLVSAIDKHAAQGIEAGTAMTEGHGPKDESPVAESDAPITSPAKERKG